MEDFWLTDSVCSAPCAHFSGRPSVGAPVSASHDPHVGAGAEDDVFAFEPGHFGQAQTCLDSQQHEGVITPAGPCALIGCRKQAVDFGPREEWDQGPCEAL